MRFINSLIRSELRKHDDLMRVIWRVGMVANYSAINVDVRKIDLLRAIDSVNTSSGSSMIEKCVYMRGINVLVYLECNMVLMDLRTVYSKILDMELPRLERPKGAENSIPNIKVKRKRVSTVQGAGGMRGLCDSAKKQIVQCSDVLMKTPNPVNGYNSNKMIMGIGIYSQYEFDMNNNTVNKQVNIVQFFNREGAYTGNEKAIADTGGRSIKSRRVRDRSVIKRGLLLPTVPAPSYSLDLILNRRYNNYLNGLLGSLRNLKVEKGVNKKGRSERKKAGCFQIRSREAEQESKISSTKVMDCLKKNEGVFENVFKPGLFSRSEVARAFLHVLNLATQGLIQIQNSTLEIRPCQV